MNRREFVKCMGYGGSVLSTGLMSSAYALGLVSEREDLNWFSYESDTINGTGQLISRRQHTANYFSQEIGSGSAIDMVYIPASRFKMGAPGIEIKRNSYESFVHQVSVDSAFISRTPITQRQWRVVSNLPKIRYELKSNPSFFKGDERPIESVSWFEAIEFCERLSAFTGEKYTLPNEALWESACRATTTSPFHSGHTLTGEYANFSAAQTYASESKGLSLHETTEVAAYRPNAYGLYDMHGNVWEWCSDSWHENYRGAPRMAIPWKTGGDAKRKVVRGGSWADEPAKLRSASRSGYDSKSLNRIIGFRVSIESA